MPGLAASLADAAHSVDVGQVGEPGGLPRLAGGLLQACLRFAHRRLRGGCSLIGQALSQQRDYLQAALISADVTHAKAEEHFCNACGPCSANTPHHEQHQPQVKLCNVTD